MRLLLSAISTSEAMELSDIADVLDLKDPSRGPLGWPDLIIVKQVRSTIASDKALSVALGDISFDQNETSKMAMQMVSAGADIVKVALANISYGQACAKLSELGAMLPDETDLVVCAYADAGRNDFFPTHDLPKLARQVGAGGILLDTCAKNGETLLDIMAIRELETIVLEARGLGLTTALAGSLRMEDIEPLAQVQPDYIGFRSAITTTGVRGMQGIDRQKAQALKTKIVEVKNETASRTV